MVKIDLHVHSKLSKRPSQWVLQKIGCPESFTEPLQIYRTAKKKGMSMVTITDHNTIAGALEIAHLPDAFVSEEITTYFPENRCKVHVLALNITEKHHLDIQKARENIFELVEYLNHENIVHILAHPLYRVNDKLTPDHFEKLILLFKNFEMNGARDGNLNRRLKVLLYNITEKDIDILSEKHRITPPFAEPWKKNFTGGSDDHSGLNIARTYTQVKDAEDIHSLLEGIEKHRAKVVSVDSTPQTMAHNLYGIAYQFYRNKFNLERHVNKDILLKFLDRSLRGESEKENGLMTKLYCLLSYRKRQRNPSNIPENLVSLLRSETERLLEENPELLNITQDVPPASCNPEKKWFDFVNQLSNKVLNVFADHLLGRISGANVFDIFQSLGSAGGLYFLLAPYFVSYTNYCKDNTFNTEIFKRFNKGGQPELTRGSSVNAVHFTDTFYEVNGVAYTLQQQIKIALKNEKRLMIITCDPEDRTGIKGVQNFKPIGVYQMPEYSEQKIFYPPFLEMLEYCYTQNFSCIHSATPGPVGLAALAISRLMNIPIYGTYHTAFPQYAQYLTGDKAIEDLTWKYTLWYYSQMDFIYVPSQSTGDELIEKGISRDKIKLFPRGINIERFHPGKRNGIFKDRYKIDDAMKLLYVGRVSKEKNLPFLVDTFKKLYQTNSDVHLVVVGDGPYLSEMKTALKGFPCTFTGYQSGETLAALYASSDIFIFPSTTDTFGNVVLEAQASGIPVVVTDQGGPKENIIPGETGFIVKANDEHALLKTLKQLIDNKPFVKKMGEAGRKYMETRSFETAFVETWKMYEMLSSETMTRFADAG